MKRCISVGMALLALFAMLIVLPAHAEVSAAEAQSWAVLSYIHEGMSEGQRVVPDQRYTKPTTITCNANVSYMLLDDGEDQLDSISLQKAGRYKIEVVNKETHNTAAYTVYVLPMLNFEDGQTFISYPTVECANEVVSMRLDAGMQNSRYITSGDVVTGLGKHDLHIEGVNGETWDYKFYVKACSAEQIFNEERGLFGVFLQVGAYEDLAIEVRVDGGSEALKNGESKFISTLGQHTINVTVDGSAISKTDFNSKPTAEELKVQVDLTLPAESARENAQTAGFELDKPLTLKLSYYNADFYLLSDWDEDAQKYQKEKKIKGDYRVATSGDHVLVAKDAEGNEIESAFFVREAESNGGVAKTRLTLTYSNPHDLWALLVAVPAGVLIVLAAWFLLRRRKIV